MKYRVWNQLQHRLHLSEQEADLPIVTDVHGVKEPRSKYGEPVLVKPRLGQPIENEIADIAIFLSYLCHDLKISLSDVVRHKLELNRSKYPADKARGSAAKYDRLT